MRCITICILSVILFNSDAFSGKESCAISGLADSYVLALSSQPGFCETYGEEAGKPECHQLTANSYQATHLSLHGLWPNQAACGHRYGYCGVKSKANHCDYTPVQLTAETSTRLQQFMPSYYYGSCLERHEWNKHGSCQNLSADEYFSLAMKWTQEVDSSLFGDYLRAHQGQYVSLSDLRRVLDDSFGTVSRGTVFLACKNTILVDITIQLPAQFSLNDSLSMLINHAPMKTGRDACGKKVKISQFSKESWF